MGSTLGSVLSSEALSVLRKACVILLSKHGRGVRLARAESKAEVVVSKRAKVHAENVVTRQNSIAYRLN